MVVVLCTLYFVLCQLYSNLTTLSLSISEVELFLLYGLRLYFAEGFARALIAIAHTIRDVIAALHF